MTIDMKRYSIIVAYVPKISSEEIEKESENILKLVQAFEGSIEKTEYMGKKPLAFTILKYNEAHYVQYYVHLPVINLKKAITSIEYKLQPKINTNIIRHMIIKLSHFEYTESLKLFAGFENQIKI